MHIVSIELDDAAQKRLELRARLAKTEPIQLARELLLGQLNVEAFPDGHIRDGCERLRKVLLALPGAHGWKWSGVEHRYWWIGFQLDPQTPVYSKIIRTLAAYLNTDLLQSWGYKPFVFTPEFGADSSKEVWWHIHTLVSMVEPAEVAEYLEQRLPEQYSDPRTWTDFEPSL